MKLPSLLDLDLEDNLSEFPAKDKKKLEQDKVRKKTNQEKRPKESIDTTATKKDEVTSDNKKRPVIPKSEYDNEGNPVLTIPDLDDVDLTSEIDRFFGKGG